MEVQDVSQRDDWQQIFDIQIIDMTKAWREVLKWIILIQQRTCLVFKHYTIYTSCRSDLSHNGLVMLDIRRGFMSAVQIISFSLVKYFDMSVCG